MSWNGEGGGDFGGVGVWESTLGIYVVGRCI